MAKGLEGWHALLNRQLQRLELGSASSPDLAGWQAFIDRVSRAYEEADEDRYLMERSQALASEEMASLNEALRQERDLRETRVAERTEALRLSEAGGEHWYQAESLRVRAALLAMLPGRLPEAHRVLDEAQALAQSQSAGRWVRHCQATRAQLLAASG